MKKYKDIKLQEMATIGRVKNLTIQVYADYNPPHFHVTKKDEYEVKLSIKNLKVISYKWQKNGKEISAKEIKEIENWLEQPNKKDKEITNIRAIKFAWKIMN